MADHTLASDTQPTGLPSATTDDGGEMVHGGPRSLRELIDRVSGRGFRARFPAEDAGLLEVLPFPFLALVGQQEM